MATRLIFIHGRSQEHKDASALKATWIEAFRKGLGLKHPVPLPISESDIRFPYYGQTLFDLVAEKPADQVSEVIIKGTKVPDAEREFMRKVLIEVAHANGVSDQEIQDVSQQDILEKGIGNWEWVQRILIALDRHVPKASAASIFVATHDVYQYLFNPSVTTAIEGGVRKAFEDDVPTIVVSHSLGTIVAYKMLKEMGAEARWNIPLFVTLGSPLGITAVRDRLRPLAFPPCVRKWHNAMDERDLVALYPLKTPHFSAAPITNKTDVDNDTDNRHGITGYLKDETVAKWIAAAIKG